MGVIDSLTKEQFDQGVFPFVRKNDSDFGNGKVFVLEESIVKQLKCRILNKNVKNDKKKTLCPFPVGSSASSENNDENKKQKNQKQSPKSSPKTNQREVIGQLTSANYCHARGHGFGIGCVSADIFKDCLHEQKSLWAQNNLELKALNKGCGNVQLEPVLVWVRDVSSLRYCPGFVYVHGGLM